MAEALQLLDIFGDFRAYWPSKIREPGIDGPATQTNWLSNLNACVEVISVRTGSSQERVAIEANLALSSSKVYPPPGGSGFPFEFASLPGVVFYLQDVASANVSEPGPVRLFVSQADTGCEVVVEGLPVEIRIPWKMIDVHPFLDKDIFGEFKPGNLDSQKVTFTQEGVSVFVHIRVRVTDESGVVVTPAVPISLGKCRFLGVPCQALHDVQIIPSPELAHENTIDWVRHDITAWDPSQAGILDGCIAVRSVHLDPEQDPVKKVLDLIAGRTSVENIGDASPGPALLVIDDIVVPGIGTQLFPIPRHLTAGIRRDIKDPTSQEEFFSLEKAPVKIIFGQDPKWGLQIEKLFYMSQPVKEMQEHLDIGVSFAVQFLLGKDQVKDPKHAPTLELAENLTLSLGYKRDPSAQDWTQYVFRWTIFGSEIGITGVKGGFSFGLAFGADKRPAKECFLVLFDLFVSMPPLGGDQSTFRLRSLSGEKLAFAIEGIGYRFGKFHLEGLALPDGVQAMVGPVALVIHELGMVSEGGATYVSFSGGLAVKTPAGFEGGVMVKRLRFRYAGNETAPSFKLDGLFARFSAPTFLIEAGGYFTDNQLNPTTRRREFGFCGTVDLHPPLVKQMLSVDLMFGEIIGDKSFHYWMFQLLYQGSIPIYCVEITMIQALMAAEMTPDVKQYASEAYEFRFYNWYREKSNPLAVDGMRRLAAWAPDQDAITFGAGFGVSFVGLGKLFDIRAFGMYLRGRSERALLIVFAMHLFRSREPVAWAVVELDWAHGRYMVMVGIQLTLDRIIQGFPECLQEIIKLTGTIVCGNNPTTVAIGRLRDQRTWLGIYVNVNLWFFSAFIQMAVCFEWVEGGDRGTAAVLRVEGGWSFGVVRLTVNAGFGWLAASFSTGTSDYAQDVWIEAGVRAILFWFFRFGLKTGLEYRDVGKKPYRIDLTVTLTFETPWFLPDITVKLQWAKGSVAPAQMQMFVSPLQAGAAIGEPSPLNFPVHIERYDKQWPQEPNSVPHDQSISESAGDPTHHTYSLEELAGMELDEETRLKSFQEDSKVEPIPTDVRIAVDFSALMNDLLGISPNTGPQGDQRSGSYEKSENNLKLRYNLSGMRIRRRPRFAAGIQWTVVEERSAQLGSASSTAQQVFKIDWQPDLQLEGETAKKRLLINSSTPFGTTVYNPQADEEMVRNNPNWPCCKGKEGYKVHRVTFRNEAPGTVIADPRFFTESTSTLRFMPLVIARPHLVAGSMTPGALVASVNLLTPGLLFRAELDEPASLCVVRLGWMWRSVLGAALELVAYDGKGTEVRKETVPLASGGFRDVVLATTNTFERFDARIVDSGGWPLQQTATLSVFPILEIDEVTYADHRDLEEFNRQQKNCDPERKEFRQRYEGKGKLFFLPNHEYEVEITTSLEASHPSAKTSDLAVKEYIYFKTKGLPGLNAQARVGEELEPYVKSAYRGGRGLVYREEPITLAFREDFLVAVPLKWRPFGGFAESDQLFKLAMTVSPDTASSPGTPFTTTDTDWIVGHRKASVTLLTGTEPWKAVEGKFDIQVSNTLTDNQTIDRLAALTQRESSPCPLLDPREVISPVLVAFPQGSQDPDNPVRQLWPASALCTATVMPEKSGFVERTSFNVADTSAFLFGRDSEGGGEESWAVEDGELRLNADATRHFAIFGEKTWDHLVAQVEAQPGAGAAGIGFAIHTHEETSIEPNPARATCPSQGIFAMVESCANGHQLAVYGRAELDELKLLEPAKPLPPAGDAPYNLIVSGFDDKLRLTVGEVSIETPREGLRAGRLALVGYGAVSFTSLRVKGLPMYSYPFHISRYSSFKEHIGSFARTASTIEASDMGAGAAVKNVAGLWAETGADCAEAMKPGSTPEKREQIFSKWLAGLGLPVDGDVTAVELTRYTEAGHTTCLLLASAEPLDFAEEITLNLSRRVVLPGQSVAIDVSKTRAAIGRLFSQHNIMPRFKEPEPPNPATIRSHGRFGTPEHLAEAPDTVLDCERIGTDRIRIVFGPGALLTDDGEIARSREIAVMEIRDSERVLYATIYQARVEPGTTTHPQVDAWETLSIPMHRSLDNTELDALRKLKAGTFIIGDRLTGKIIGVYAPRYAFEEVDIRILQNGAATQAIIFPLSGTAPGTLSPGTYKFDFTMNRKRWETNDPQNELNHYRGNGTLINAL